MPRLDFEDFIGEEATRIYIAGGLEEAKRVESILTAHGVNYAVDVEPYFKPMFALLSLCAYAGAGFYVESSQSGFARDTIRAAGLRVGLEDGEPR